MCMVQLKCVRSVSLMQKEVKNEEEEGKKMAIICG